MRTILFILSCIFTVVILNARTVASDSVTVHFRQSHIQIDPAFKGNGKTLDSIFKKLGTQSPEERTRALRHISVTGNASPEGTVKFNEYLSEKRAEAILKLFQEKGMLPEDTETDHHFSGRDWSGLRRAVRADSAVPSRRKVLNLLDSILGPNPPAHPLSDLKRIDKGIPYRYLYTELFPGLRASTLIIEYEELFPPIILENPERLSTRITVIPDMPSIPELKTIEPYTPIKECKPFYMGLKSNLLYDALLLPNIGAEFYIGKGWSLTADWMYGWWDRDRSHYYWRAYGGTIGARKWFGRKASEKPLTGHHLGIFAGVVTYDFELGKGGIMGGLPHRTLWDRCNIISGVEYGYSLPVARRLNIDFTIGIGYLGGKYLKYEPKDGFYIWQSTHRLHWFGPTKAEVSLVWLLGCDNYNRRKGGAGE